MADDGHATTGNACELNSSSSAQPQLITQRSVGNLNCCWRSARCGEAEAGAAEEERENRSGVMSRHELSRLLSIHGVAGVAEQSKWMSE
jgi:hypothetical protein